MPAAPPAIHNEDLKTYYLMMLSGLNFSKHLASELAILCRDSSEYAVFKFNLIHFSSKTFVVGLRILENTWGCYHLPAST